MSRSKGINIIYRNIILALGGLCASGVAVRVLFCLVYVSEAIVWAPKFDCFKAATLVREDTTHE